MAPVSTEDVLSISSALNWKIPENDILDYADILAAGEKAFQIVLELDDYQPVPDFEKTPRTNIRFPKPEDNPHNAWAWRFEARHPTPRSKILAGETLCLKDNIAVAGVPCLLGTDTFTDWTPKTDATVASRILYAAGTITGKAVCENLSRGAASFTAATGPVHNPGVLSLKESTYVPNYSAGGSSSGTAALIASKAATMGIGCDQGGSIRIPAALCGLVGLKATAGLVPYTGIASNDANLDYVGPITVNVMDCARLLEVISGVDGLDDRQGPGCPLIGDVPKYEKLLEGTRKEGMKGVKIGILKEALEFATMDPALKETFWKAVDVYKCLGAVVEEVSVPFHSKAPALYGTMSKLGNHIGMQGRATGRRGLMLTDLMDKKNLPYSQQTIDKMNTTSKDGLLIGEYGWQKYPTLYSKCVNLNRKLAKDYDEMLEKYDVLIMPTTLTPAVPLPRKGAGIKEQASISKGKVENTCPFNASGHPALALPIGYAERREEGVKVPASMQIVGKWWDEVTVLRVGLAWEDAMDWRSL